jgi:tetratricopeptide (TPR) repeat protein
MSSNRIGGQPLRDMTVQIRDATGAIRGTGVIISPYGDLATCAHVIRSCGADPFPGNRVNVHIPKTPHYQSQDCGARVVWAPSDYEDDLVVLEMELVAPLATERVCVCGSADGSDYHTFRSFGFRIRDHYAGLYAEGLIEGHVESSKHLLLEPVQLNSGELDSGMSGAPVFDVDRNLVVAFVTQVWDSDRSQKDRDLAFAVDAGLLEHSPVKDFLVEGRLVRSALPTSEVDNDMVDISGPRTDRWDLSRAPSDLGVFVGRSKYLAQLTNIWLTGETRVLAIVAIGGQGKTSLVKHWLDLQRTTSPRPRTSVFWWTFDRAGNDVDDFLTALILHLADAQVDPDLVPTTSARAHLAASLLEGARRHLVVLDGMDALQCQGGEVDGDISSPALKQFLGYVAAAESASMVVLTTQIPLAEFAHLTTVSAFELAELTAEEGRELLVKNGLYSSISELSSIVEEWGGHALALTIVAKYLSTTHGGSVLQLSDLPIDPNASLLQRLTQLADLNETSRSPAAIEAISLLSLMRMPLAEEALIGLICHLTPEATVSDVAREVRGLTTKPLMRTDQSGRMLLHPVLRNFYRARLGNSVEARTRHRILAEHYYSELLERRKSVKENNLNRDSIRMGVEIVHHACRAGEYDAAAAIFYNHVYRGPEAALVLRFGNVESAVECLTGLFPEDDLSADPIPRGRQAKRWILHEAAACLHRLGRLDEATALGSRSVSAAMRDGDFHNAAVSYHNLAESHLASGALTSCRDAAEQALALSRRSQDLEDELVACTLLGTVGDLSGQPDEGSARFDRALQIARTATSVPILYSLSGIRYAEHLRLIGRNRDALKAAAENLDFSTNHGWQADVAIILSQIARFDPEADSVELCTRAVRIARTLGANQVLVSTLLARVEIFIRLSRWDDALRDIRETLDHIQTAGYRLLQVDARLMSATIRIRQDDVVMGRADAELAESLSTNLGYEFGRRSAGALLASLE